MIRVAVVDDEKETLNELQGLINKYSEENNVKFNISFFSDGDELVDRYTVQKEHYDIIFLDIRMPFMNGMEAAKKIRQQDKEVGIIFVTNMTQYAVQGYKVDALDYVLKPISYTSLSKCITKAIERMKKNKTKYITVPVKNGVYRIEISDIYYVESQKHVLVFHTKLGDFKTYGKMTEAEQQLSQVNFYRVNKGYLINLSQVIGIMNNDVILPGGQHIPLSRTRKKSFMEALAAYWQS